MEDEKKITAIHHNGHTWVAKDETIEKINNTKEWILSEIREASDYEFSTIKSIIQEYIKDLIESL